MIAVLDEQQILHELLRPDTTYTTPEQAATARTHIITRQT